MKTHTKISIVGLLSGAIVISAFCGCGNGTDKQSPTKDLKPMPQMKLYRLQMEFR